MDVALSTGEPLWSAAARAGAPHEIFPRSSTSCRHAQLYLVLEDLHWADAATSMFSRLLGRRVEAVRALVIATYRDDEIDETAPLRVVLGGLATSCAPSHGSRSSR